MEGVKLMDSVPDGKNKIMIKNTPALLWMKQQKGRGEKD